ncbi:unnamed protein product [Gongylonema pulchrum]|uniref:Uncharacterized protein n=1 Tax=Gongylonema pulchrum TaxID=637853 RepID=A0A3P7MJG2_9BILA|nr:unnamed protein product [Gongylonema pulchrum]
MLNPLIPKHLWPPRSHRWEEDDVGFEEDILKNPFSLRSWLRYIEHKKKCKSPLKQINLVYERALKELPGSYKLWYSYLRFRRKQVADKCPTDPSYVHVNNAYERALVFMHKMPRIWMEYGEFLIQQRFITRTRRVFDRALRALPVTQHDRIWPLYIKFVTSHEIPETTIRVYRRYLKLLPKHREDFVDYLRKIDHLDDAAQQLAILVNDDKPYSEHGKTTHQLWTELCELISKNPIKVHSLNVDSIIRQGIRRAEHLMHRRPLLLNSVLLRQNPHNAYEWLNRVQLYDGNKQKARLIFEKGLQPEYTKVDDLASVWCEYAEYELRHRYTFLNFFLATDPQPTT